ncbi:class I SAM-dependent methyltransferase [Microbacterium sp. 179-I 3D3 NHS]|uniref:class I SAM-dependent methyltransferase n=1 Tax=Microbacterium sp. 179-I 3D3 NHS TaxID=3142382 RepID=UPI0039A0D4ED
MKSWTGVGGAYAESYAELCAGTVDVLIDLLGDPAGRRLIDVGSGTGDLAARLADAGWQASGCEPEPTMRAVSAHRHPDLPVVDGGLPALPFAPGSFEVATANFVLNHVDDPRLSARGMAEVVAPRGLLAASCWTVSPSWFWRDVRERAGVGPGSEQRIHPDKDFARTGDGFRRMLTEGDWEDVEVSESTWTWRIDADRLWRSAEGGVASAGQFYLGLDAEERRRFGRAFDAVCAEYEADGALALEHTAAVAVGRAA